MAPLYRQLADTLSTEIGEGVYRIGSLLPSEAELRARFGVSRQTVREAIRLLAESGLVSRRQGAGTLVARDRVAERYVQRLGRPADLSRYVRETTLKVLRIADVAALDAAVALPGDDREAWRMLEGLRYLVSERKPIAWTQVYLRGVYGAVATDRDRDDVPLYALVERRYGVKALTVQQEIAGVAIEPGVAALLRVAAGSVGLSVRREYVSTSGEVFEVAISVHPADRYRYRTQLALDEPPPPRRAGPAAAVERSGRISARRRGSGSAR